MNGDYDGRQYVGVDLHRRRSVIVRMTPDGEQLGWVRIDNDPVALGLELAKAGPDPEVVLEATYGWYWAVDVLQTAGATVHLAHPLGVKGFAYRRVKNDVRDDADLADAQDALTRRMIEDRKDTRTIECPACHKDFTVSS